jgi:hypothetical protein
MADHPNYMFHGNLETIKRIIDEMVQLDPQEVSQILNDGHEWAEDHIATSLDDIQEVHNFLKSRLSVNMDHQHSHHDHHEHDHKKDMGDFLQSFESFTFKK